MSTAPAPRWSLRDPSELIAAIPSLLGVRPTDSLVLVLHDGPAGNHVLRRVLRIDLPEPDDIPGWVDQLRRVVARDPAAQVELVVFGGQVRPSDIHTDRVPPQPPYQDLIAALTTALTQDGAVIGQELWAASADPGSRWQCFRDPARGATVADPAAVAMVAELTVSGAVTYRNRQELAAVLTPDPPAVLARRAELIARLPAALPNREIHFLRELVEQVHCGQGREPVLDDATIARLALALGDGRVRDTALILCAGPQAAAAQWVWTVLVRAVPRPWVAYPALLLGMSAYLSGAGPLASQALELACAADPNYAAAQHLRRSLYQGVPPAVLRRMLHDSVQAAAEGTSPSDERVANGPGDDDPVAGDRV